MTYTTGFKSPPRNHSNTQSFQQIIGGFAPDTTDDNGPRNPRKSTQLVSVPRSFMGPIVGTR
jgi:hypothetical protein